MSTIDLEDLYRRLDKQANHSEPEFWFAYKSYLADNPGGLSLSDQIAFFGIVMDNSEPTPVGTWATPQLAMGAILTGYNGANWDYLTTPSCPYIPWTPDFQRIEEAIFPAIEWAKFPAVMFPYSSPPAFWPPALFGTAAVLNDRYMAARVLRLSLAITVQGQNLLVRGDLRLDPLISQVQPGSPGAAPYNPADPHPISPAGGGESQAVKSALAIATTLSFALPPPYGPILAGTFGLLSLFMSSGDSATAELIKALKAIDADIKDYISRNFFDQDLSAITTCSNWINVQLQGLTDMGWDLWANEDWIQELKAFTEPGQGDVYQATNNIWNLHLTTKWENGALDAWIAGESLVLMSLKLLLQTYALNEARARLADDEAAAFSARAEWWNWYDRFSNEVSEWSGKALRWIQDQIDGRLTTVLNCNLEIPDDSHQELVIDTGLSSCIGWSWFSQRDWILDPMITAAAATKHQIDGQIPKISNIAQLYRDYVCGHADGSHTGLAGGLDTSFAGAIKAITGWVRQQATWTAAVPPLAPSAAPAVQVGPGQGNAWPAGARVSYAYSLGNVRGDSTPSLDDANGPPTNWSLAVAVSSGRYPKLTFDVAADTHRGGTSRYVYRRMNANGTPQLQCISAMSVADSSWTDTYVLPLNQ